MQPPNASNQNFWIPESRLILVGASVRAAAQSAARAGFLVTGVDLFGDIDTIAACEHYLPLVRSTVASIADLHPDPATPIIVVGGLESGFRLVGQLQQHYRPLESAGQRQQQVRRPEVLQQVARAAGVRFPESGPADNSLRRSGRWLVKDPESCGGLAVHWADSPPVRCSPNAYGQCWVTGRPFGATFLGDGSSSRLLGVCRGRFTKVDKRPFVYAGSCGPVAVATAVRDAIRRIGAKLAGQCALQGIFNVDLMIDGEDIWLLEVNPRWTASCELIERAMIDAGMLSPQESLFGLGIRAHANGFSGSAGSAVPVAGYLKRIVFSRTTGRFDRNRIHGVAEWGAELADIPPQQRLIQAGEPILTVILRDPLQGKACWQDLKRLFAQVQKAVC